MSVVSETPAAPPEVAAAHFAARLALETDCWDVHAATRDGAADFVLLDVRTPALYARGHVPGAVSLPRREIDRGRMAAWPADTACTSRTDAFATPSTGSAPTCRTWSPTAT